MKSLLPVFTLLVTSACADSGPTLPDDIGRAGDGNLDAQIEFIRDAHGLPALGGLLVQGDQIVEMGAVGARAVGSPEQVTTSDRWHLGSLTKAMTATLAARLVDQGVIDWNTTITDVFPDFTNAIRSEYEDVALDELLYHTAAMTVNVTLVPFWATARDNTDPLHDQRVQWSRELLELPPEGRRGEHRYSNAGYIVAGAMLEEVTGELWEDLMVREVFEPLGMSNTGFGPPGTTAAVDQPRGHVANNGNWAPVEPGPAADNPVAIGPAGTVHSTFADFAKYIAAHLAGARGTGGLVSAESFAKLHAGSPGNDYSLGWGLGVRDWAGGRVLQHSGSNTIWFATVWLAPERNFALFAVSNAGGVPAQRGSDTVVEALIDRFDAAIGSN